MREDTTFFLEKFVAGNSSAAEELLPRVYDELHKVATNYLNNERRGHTLQATALVHEAYLRLIDVEKIDWQGRSHFMAIASRFMRRILVDYARSKLTDKRCPDGRRVPFRADLVSPATGDQPTDTLALHEALEQLEGINTRHAKVVEMRYFAGLGVRETAHVLGVSEKTVKNDWRAARAWLLAKLNNQDS